MSIITADIAQTFYVDPEAVKKASYIFISKIGLYFYSKPTIGNSGIAKPGATVYICETKNVNNMFVPDLENKVRYGRARLEYDSINVTTNGLTVTDFDFNVPVPLKTGTFYAIVIKFDGADTGFSLWRNKANETYNNVVSPSITKGALDGHFFVLTNGVNPTPLSDTDLKFAVTACKFDTSSTYSVVNRDFELLFIDNSTKTGNNFIGGERVFSHTGFPSGQTVSFSVSSNVVIGTSTTFQTDFVTDDYIVINSGDTYDVRRITSIANNTQITVDYTPSTTNTSGNYLVAPIAVVHDYRPESSVLSLVASTSNSTVNFYANASSNTLYGALSGATVKSINTFRFPVNEFMPRFGYLAPAETTVNTYVRFANSTYGTVSTARKIENNRKVKFTDFAASIHSRSDEVTQGGITLDGGKSINFDIEMATTNEYTTPMVDEEDLIFNVYRRIINNTTVNEARPNGQAYAKYISKRINLDDGQDAEDIRVYLTAYRPAGTNVHVYVKFYNDADPDSFEDKDWTKLDEVAPKVVYSSSSNDADLIELEYKLPNYPYVISTVTGQPLSGTTLTGSFTGENANNILLGTSGIVNTEIQATDLVRIYDPLFANNCLLAVVTAADATTFTIDTELSSSNTVLTQLCTGGLTVEKVDEKHTAFNNFTNDGIIRYYSKDMSALDTYKSFAFKIVLTAENEIITFPFVDDIRGIALSV